MKDLKKLRYVWCIPIIPLVVLMCVVGPMLIWVGKGFSFVGDFVQRWGFELSHGEVGCMDTYRNRFILWYRRPIDKFISKREAKNE